MIAGKFDPQQFFRHADHVALYVSAGEIFGLLRRSLDLPRPWSALVTQTSGEHVVVSSGGVVTGREAEDVLFARVSTIDVALEEADLITADQYQCRADVRLRVSLIPETGELLSFRKAILGSRRVAKTAAVAEFLRPAIRAALVDFAAEHSAAALVHAGSMEAVALALLEAVKAACFSAGLKLEVRPTVQFDSKTLRQVEQSQQNVVRRQAEHEAAQQLHEAQERARAQHLDQLSSLLGRLRELADESPDAALPTLIRTFTEKQRGELYEALFAAEAKAVRTTWIVVSTGDELLFFDGSAPESPQRRIRVTGPVGAVRSVQAVSSDAGPNTLMLGAARGVYRLPVDRAEPDLTLAVPDPPSVRGGFNAVTRVDDRVVASHSELGLYEWDVLAPLDGRPLFESMTRGAEAVRHMQHYDGDFYASIDARIIRWPVDGAGDEPEAIYVGSLSTITALCPTEDGVYAGTSDGDVLHWPAGRVKDPETLHRGTHRAAESMWALSSHGVRQLVYTNTSPAVHTRVIGDSFACRYEAGGQTLRRVEVAPDLIVATNELRDRLFCWTPGKPAKPSAVLPVSSLSGRSIQDVCLIT